MTITLLRASKAANTPQPRPPTEPAPSKNNKDTIEVSKKKPEATRDTSNNRSFAPSKTLSRTPPLQTAHPTPPPGAPSKPTQRHSMLADPAPTDDKEEKEEQETRHQTQDGKPANILAALQAVRDKLTGMHTTGKNIETKVEILKELNAIIDTVTEEKHTTEVQQINNMADDIKDIKATIRAALATKPETWAQVAAAPGNQNIQLEAARRERLEKIKKEREKTEVTLSLHNATGDMRNMLSQMEEKAIANCLQENLRDRLASEDIEDVKIRGIRKATKDILKIQCDTEEDALTLKKLKWETILDGATTMKTTHSIVLNGVSKQHIDLESQSQEEIKALLEQDNNIKVSRVTRLMRKVRNPNAPTQSLVAHMESLEDANYCINNDVRIGHRIYTAERYIPQCQIRQCFNCQGYGHKAETCTRPPRCGKCAQEHETRKCDRSSDKTSCVHCEGSHPAWHHECPRRQKEHERLELLKATIPHTFLC